jgi:hypothetical protein
VGTLDDERGRSRDGCAPFRAGAAVGYLNLNFAVCMLPSLSVTFSWRQVPAHALSVFQT